MNTLKAEVLGGLGKGAVTDIATAPLAQLRASKLRSRPWTWHIARLEREIKLKDAEIERITFELARLKAWKFGLKTESMDAEQRKLFEDTLVKDEADLETGAGKTAKAFVWAHTRGEYDGTPGVICDVCTRRGSKYPADFLSA